MAIQSRVTNLSATPCRPGVPIGSLQHGDTQTRLLGGLGLKLITLTIATVTDSATYTVAAIGGLDEDGNETSETISYEADGTATATEIRNGLLAAAQANANIVRRLNVYTTSTTTTVYFEARVAGDDFTFTESDSKLTSAVTTAAGSAQQLKFGRGVCRINANEIALPEANGNDIAYPFLGVSEEWAREVTDLSATEAYHVTGDSVPVHVHGEITVEVEPGVNPVPGDTVYVRYSTSGSNVVGMFTKTNEANKTLSLSTRARWTDGPRGTWAGRQVASLFLI